MKSRIRFATAMLLGGLASSVAHGQTSISCNEEPGLSACRQLRYFQNLLVTCTGEACDDLFEKQIRQADLTVDYYFNHIDGIADASADIGELAKTTSRKTCYMSWRGTAETIGRIQIAVNRLLQVMETLQVMAKVEKKETCTLGD